jgi:hypothetical protein
MAEIIQLHKKSTGREDDRITARPLEFRRPPWKSSHFIQVARSDWPGRNSPVLEPPEIPPHFVLKGSLADTILGIYIHRENEDRMKKVYYLAGLIDCLVNQVNPLLRTFLINDIYKKISLLKNALNLNWYGHIDRVLLPLAPGLYDQERYREGISCSRTLKTLYSLIMQGTGEMFDILSQEYIFFTPGEGV